MPDSEPLRVEGFIPAVRAWWVYQPNPESPHGSEPILRSSVTRYVYPGPVCRNSEPPRPGVVTGTAEADRDPSVGFFAFKIRDEQVARYLKRYMSAMGQGPNGVYRLVPKAFGRVSLFGRVRVHERGFRAEGVRIERLWVGVPEHAQAPWDEIATGLADRYRCPVDLWTGGVPTEDFDFEAIDERWTGA